MNAYLDPLLPPGEVIQHFVKSPGGSVLPGLRYIVITNQSVVECWFHDSGRTFRYPFSEFVGMDACGGYVRLVFNSSHPDDDDVLCLDFLLPEVPEFMAFYGKLAVACERATGQPFKDQIEAGRSSVPKMRTVAHDQASYLRADPNGHRG